MTTKRKTNIELEAKIQKDIIRHLENIEMFFYKPTKKTIDNDLMCLKLLKMGDYYGVFWRQNTAGIFVPGSKNGYRPSKAPGVADIIGVMSNGRMFTIEVKRPGEKLKNPFQRFFRGIMETLTDNIYILAYSVDDVRIAFHNAGYKS